MKDATKRAHEPWKAFQARQRNQDIKRDAVLQTAAHMFLEQGYRRTSMSDLAKRLQITKPALYYYFRNKEELLVECCRAGITLIETLLDKALVSRGTGLDKVKVYIEAYAKSVVLHDFGRCVSVLDENELSIETRKQVRALKRRIDASIRGYIEEGVADKSIAALRSQARLLRHVRSHQLDRHLVQTLRPAQRSRDRRPLRVPSHRGASRPLLNSAWAQRKSIQSDKSIALTF